MTTPLIDLSPLVLRDILSTYLTEHPRQSMYVLHATYMLQHLVDDRQQL
jgi:hypothetical protein